MHKKVSEGTQAQTQYLVSNKAEVVQNNLKRSQIQRLNQLIGEELSLFIRLIRKTKEKITKSINRIKQLIQALQELQISLIVKLLKKSLHCMKKVVIFLRQLLSIIEQSSEQKYIINDCLDQTKEQNTLNFENRQLFIKKLISKNIKKQDINIGILTDVISAQHNVLDDFESLEFKIYYSINSKKIKSKIKQYARKAINLISKMTTLNTILPLAAFFPLNDLFSCCKTHPRWIYLETHYIKKKVLGVSKDVREKFSKYVDYMSLFMYFIFQVMNKAQLVKFKGKQEVYDQSWINFLDFIIKKGAKEELQTVYSLDTNLFPKVLWNITTDKSFKTLVNPVMPSINYSFSLFVPKTRRKQIFDSIYDSQKQFKFILPKYKDHFNSKLYRKMKPYKTHAEVHINSNFDFLDGSDHQNKQTIILHIHGGGFISMSSYMHQFYTRRWAKKMNVPILSIQYGKAPQYPFPNALADCIQVYLWLVEHSQQLFHTKNLKIILMGDSSGGNLVCSLTNYLIRHKLPLPDKLLLFYPALRVDVFYTPSFIHCLQDMLLSHSVLFKIRQAYVGSFPEKQSQLLSPLNTSHKILSKYPSVVVLTGSHDPLSDDCFRMVEKLNEAKKGNALMTVFEDFPHGFLHFDTDIMPNPYVRQAYSYIQEILTQMLHQLSE